MLRYLGLGKRFFGDQPMPAHKRVNWEFMAVMRGKIAPFATDGDPRVPVSDRVWLFPPGTIHGWGGDAGKTCEVVVVHFSNVPQAVDRLALRHGHLETALKTRDKTFLNNIAKTLKRHYWRPTLESDIHAQRALMDLSLLLLRDYKERMRFQSSGGSLSRVIAAENWLRAHLTENPSVSEAAEAVGLSVSQLNRLFCAVRRESPQRVLNRIKIDRAMELLGSTNAKLDSVADECGFTTASNLCRAFKAQKGDSPTMWRHEKFIQYKAPGRSTTIDHTAHGRRLRLIP